MFSHLEPYSIIHYWTINDIIIMGIKDRTFFVTVVPHKLRPFKTVMKELFVIEDAF